MQLMLTLAQAAPGAKDTLEGKAKDAAKKASDRAENAKGGDAPNAENPDDAENAEQSATTKGDSGVETKQGDAWHDHGAIGLMKTGGLFMWPILILGVLAAGVIIERYRSLRMLRTNTAGLRDEVREMLQADQPEDALKVVDDEEGPVPAVLGTGLRKYVVLRRLGYDSGRLEQGVIKSMEDYGVHIVAALERHLPILATIASVAPMLGFLGTVAGMIEAFDQIELLAGKENIIKLAAGGIKVALLTTCFGLIVGIPVYMAYNYFTGLINRFVLEVEESATELIESVTLQNAISDAAN